MTKIISAYEARVNFGDLMNQVYYGGEEVIVTKTGRPMIRIEKVTDSKPAKQASYYIKKFKALGKIGKQINTTEYLRKERNSRHDLHS